MSDLKARIEAVLALADNVGPSKFDTAEASEEGIVECPLCDCGEVEATTLINIDARAVTMQFYGVGNDFGKYQALWESLPAVANLLREVLPLIQDTNVEAAMSANKQEGT